MEGNLEKRNTDWTNKIKVETKSTLYNSSTWHLVHNCTHRVQAIYPEHLCFICGVYCMYFFFMQLPYSCKVSWTNKVETVPESILNPAYLEKIFGSGKHWFRWIAHALAMVWFYYDCRCLGCRRKFTVHNTRTAIELQWNNWISLSLIIFRAGKTQRCQ